MMIGRLEAARDTQQQLVESGSISGAPKRARLYVFYQPITVCVLEASPSGVNAGADHKESVPIGQAVGEFVSDLIGGLVRLDNPGAVELKSSVPEPRDAL
jgi:hypothetical protein